MGADLLKIMHAQSATTVEDLVRLRFQEIIKALETAPHYDLVAPDGQVFRIRRVRLDQSRGALVSSAIE